MDKTSYETRMKRLKEQILEEHQPPTSSSACDPTPSTSSSTCDPTSSTYGPTLSTSSHTLNETYVYGVGMHAVLAIGVCVFFAYNSFPNNSFLYNSFPKNKRLANEKQDQPPKRRHML